MPYRTHNPPPPEEKDNSEMFPVSPWYGPTKECPKCGEKNSYYSLDGRLNIRRVTDGIFCGPRQRMRLRWFPWPKYCTHPSTHIHQTCLVCGAKFVSLPLSQKSKETNDS